MCNALLSATNVASQAVAANGFVNFDVNRILTNCKLLNHVSGSNAILVKGCGIYSIFVDLNIVPTAAGNITVQLLNNGEAIPAAQATILATAGNSYHISISTLLRILKSCCVVDNAGSLQVQITGAATVNNANIIVIQEA